jgi:hypothetical protein
MMMITKTKEEWSATAENMSTSQQTWMTSTKNIRTLLREKYNY